jgi:ubiquinone biosynthesis monooxygenase Coq7
MMIDIDRCITEFDKGLRTIFGVHPSARPMPGKDLPEADLSEAERRHAAALMRVNHCGEVCAQALYQGQALASDNEGLRDALDQAAREEADHLAWCERRISELGGRLSALNPIWYAGSLAIGYVAGKLGDEWNLGFLAETEHQVEHHLQGHLERLSADDARTRAVVEQMQRDEAGHADAARRLGARDLPVPAKGAMRMAARLMTTASYWI